MRLHCRILIPILTAASAFTSDAHTNSAPRQSTVALTKLAPPAYPQLARQTRITGDVRLLLNVRPDGTVESASVVSGHPLLQQAALDSAQESQFACEGCSNAITSYSLVYTFLLTEGHCPSSNEPPKESPQEEKSLPQVTQSQNHVTIIAEGTILCDPGVAFRRVRSAKCLYLWKCAWKP